MMVIHENAIVFDHQVFELIVKRRHALSVAAKLHGGRVATPVRVFAREPILIDRQVLHSDAPGVHLQNVAMIIVDVECATNNIVAHNDMRASHTNRVSDTKLDDVGFKRRIIANDRAAALITNVRLAHRTTNTTGHQRSRSDARELCFVHRGDDGVSETNETTLNDHIVATRARLTAIATQLAEKMNATNQMATRPAVVKAARDSPLPIWPALAFERDFSIHLGEAPVVAGVVARQQHQHVVVDKLV